ncbi:hypothetical protein [Rhizobium ruizarguesonis]
MVRTSQFLRILRLQFDAQAQLGLSVEPHRLPDICRFLKFTEDQCAEMEARLAGEPMPAGRVADPDSNIVSLAEFVASRSGEAFPFPRDNA